jgi:hypothetical protein
MKSMGTINADDAININTFYDHEFVFEAIRSDGAGSEEDIQAVHFTKGFDNEEIELRYNEDLKQLKYQSFTVASDDASSDVDEIKAVEQKDRLQLKVDMTYVLNQIGPTKHQDTIQFDSKYKLLDKSILTAGRNHSLAQELSEITRYCYSSSNDSSQQFLPCMATNIMNDITALSDAKSKMQLYSSLISGRLRNYTCIDESMQTSTPIYTYNTTLQYRGMDREYEVNVLLDKNNSKIWTVDNFVSKEECDVFVEHGTPKLQRATVAAADGSSVVSESRKANQAGYKFSGPLSDDPLGELYQRLLNMTNLHAGLQLQRGGQEEFTIIQYNIDDQYT